MRLYSLIALACLTSSTVQADVILTNLSRSIGSGTVFGLNTSSQYKAFNFTMGGVDHTLTGIVLALNGLNGVPNPLVEIWSDGGGTPGAPLFALDNPTAPIVGAADYTFTAGSPFILAAGTSYWVYVRSIPVDGDSFRWEGSSPATMPTGPGATGVRYEFNGNDSMAFNRLQIEGDVGFGTTYCDPGTNNSTGQPGELLGSGSLVAADNNLTLEAVNLPADAFGFFITSQMQGLIQNPGGSAGNLCVTGAIGRYVGPGQIQNSGAAGVITLALDLTMTPTPTGLVPVQSGETWNFQAWHRDFGPAGPSSNFTNGLQVDFQ